MHLRTFFASCVFVSFFLPSHGKSTAEKHLMYQYDPITWVENLAVRPNGKILPITTTSALLNEIDPATGTLELVHDFSLYGNAIQGITEVTPDVFAVNVLTCTIAVNLSCTPGTVSTWIVDYKHTKPPHAKPEVRMITRFPDAGFLNGMATLDSTTILIADSFLGGIWSLDVWTGRKKLVFTDASMNGTEAIATGINGIRVRPGWLYYTNSAKGTFNRIPINKNTGAKSGNPTTIGQGLLGPDDFEVDTKAGVAYLCNGAADEVLKINLENGENQTIAKIPGPTSMRWKAGPKSKMLYVSDVGGLAQYVTHNVTVGGAIYQLSPGK